MTVTRAGTAVTLGRYGWPLADRILPAEARHPEAQCREGHEGGRPESKPRQALAK
jgi:hypothetical protein